MFFYKKNQKAPFSSYGYLVYFVEIYIKRSFHSLADSPPFGRRVG